MYLLTPVIIISASEHTLVAKSSSDHWLHFDVGVAALFPVLSVNLSSISSREVWLDVLVVSGGSCIPKQGPRRPF